MCCFPVLTFKKLKLNQKLKKCNAHGPYIIGLHLHSTREYAQWGVALLTCDSGVTCMSVCSVCVLHASRHSPPQLTKHCLAVANLWGQLLSPWKLNVSMHPEDCPPYLYLCVCARPCVSFISSDNWLRVKLTCLCLFSALRVYFNEQMDDAPCFQYRIHISSIGWNLFGCLCVLCDLHEGQCMLNIWNLWSVYVRKQWIISQCLNTSSDMMDDLLTYHVFLCWLVWCKHAL